MKLKRLVIQGFKSFKDRTTIHFDDGITGIVGPNGCGKSNIVDALFWVMGEQSAKHLRGKSMKDLIFAGSSKYNPGGFAEATLVLGNEGGKHIHIGNKVSSPSEIQLTRKLYRNGETEYRINNIPARLRDIQEVFMDTGAGAKSYSIIAQGEINRLVQAKPEERRSMIEDVAGITKFKLRKKESLKKIEQTQLNLNRLQDLQSEIEKNLKALQKQAERAEKARSLKEKIKRNDIVVNAHKAYDLLKDLRDGRTILNEKVIEVETWSTRKNSLEISLEEERFKKEEQAEKIEILQKERNELSTQLATSEERFVNLCKNLTDKEALIETRQKEMDELKEELVERETKIQNLKTSLEELQTRNEESCNFEELEEKLEMMKEQLELKAEQVDSLKISIEEKKSELTSLEQSEFQNSSKLEEFAGNLEDITEEIEVLEKQYSGVSTQIADERDAVHAAQALSDELSLKESELKEVIEKLISENKSLELELKEKSKILITTESKLSSLKEISAAMDGVREGAANFLEGVDNEKYQLLGNLIQCDEVHAKAVQNLLSDFMDTLVSTEDEFAPILEWCKTNDDKALEFLSPNKNGDMTSEESIERLKVATGGDITPVHELLNLPEEYRAKLTPFFDGYFISNSLTAETFNGVSDSIKFKAISSSNGKTLVRNVGNGKILTMSGSSEGQGIVERNNQILELEKNLEVLEVEVAALESKCNDSSQSLEDKRDELELLRNQLSESKSDFASKNSALESKLAGMETGNARLDILQNRKSEISKARLDLLESEDSISKKKALLCEDLEDKTSRYEELNDELVDFKSTYETERESYMEKQVEINTFKERVNSFESQIEDIKLQMEKQTNRISSNEELIEKYNEEIELTNNSIDELETSNQNMASELTDKDDVLNIMKDDLTQLLFAMQEREDEVKELTKKVNKNDKEITEYELKLAQWQNEEVEVVKNIFEKYQIDLRDAIGGFLEYSEEDHSELLDVQQMYFMETESGLQVVEKQAYEFHRRYGQDLKECAVKLKNYKQDYSRLGEINWQAIEDYDRQKLRFDFLRVQEVELKQSLDDLETAINHIDEKSKERFKIAFEEVDVRFRKVFPIIFGGGEAMLKITGDIDDAECGVDIIAKPPGKKMQNINLMSGGEKAMTAVSLIFSIFLVKPSPFCLLDEVDAPLDDANVGRFNELLREMSSESQFILITHNKKTMELNDTLYGVTMQEPGVSKAVSVQLH
ncbi:chromosome segregation protein SMC [Halobacteriovorax sp. HLS]|uniref:chromosome segregation protein SMC n=1 Tax=Halobacteriovorax sp. HLS TaxID=2234000 RepID=UPI0013E3D704|nr:chromosome segregation protein SMC [Halobacteriovorax sp. HLS]